MHHRTLMIVAALSIVGARCGVSFGQAILAEAYLESAAAAREDGNTAKSARLYALALAESHGQQNAHLTAKALLGAATIHIDLSEFDQAEENVRAALALCESLPAPPTAELATALNCMAMISYHRGEFEQAEACYARLRRDLDSDAAKGLAWSVVTNDLALVKIALDEPQAAIVLAQAAADVMEATFGGASAHYAQCLDTLARALLAAGRPDEAEPVAKESLEICAAEAGEGSAQYGSSLLTLGRIQHARGEHAAAAHNAEISMGLQANTRGEAHPLTRSAREELAAMGADYASRAAVRRPTPDELAMFDEMYEGLGLTSGELSALLEHWLGLSGPERLEHYLDFHAEVAARGAGVPAARLADASAANAEAEEPEPEDDEALFHELFGRHGLSPEDLRQRRGQWDRLAPDERRAAAALFRQSIGSGTISK